LQDCKLQKGRVQEFKDKGRRGPSHFVFFQAFTFCILQFCNPAILASTVYCHSVFSPSSRARLTERDLGRFPDNTLFHRVARAVCRAGCLPRKELYEAWEMARRVRRLFRGGRVIDLGAGHGLLAHMMLLLDDSSCRAVIVDKTLPDSSANLHDVLVRTWPRLSGRIAFVAGALDRVNLLRTDVVVSSHACGALTDLVLERAVAARARVAVLPCCHDLAVGDTGELTGWVEGPLAIDIVRAMRLKQHRYRVWTQTIPAGVTPKNRLLLGAPLSSLKAQVSRLNFKPD
jgi:hypothetical protein